MGHGDVYTITTRSWTGDRTERNRLCYTVTTRGRGVMTYRISSKIESTRDIGNYKIFLTSSGSLYVCSNFKDYQPTFSNGYKRI